MQRIAGKIAVVTGGSRGIGAAIARRLAREGATVAITYPNDRDPPTETLRAIADAGGTAFGVEADSADAAAVEAAIDRIAGEHGRIDILVNNAGAVLIGMIDQVSIEDFDRIVAINVRGVFVASRAVLKHMGEGGRIITIGSCNAERMPFPTGSIYALTKAAVAGFTRGLARDLGPRGITVNAVQPGPTNTDMNPSDGEYAELSKSFMALDRFAQPDEIAGMVAYLASEEAAFITGAGLTIDGGYNA